MILFNSNELSTPDLKLLTAPDHLKSIANSLRKSTSTPDIKMTVSSPQRNQVPIIPEQTKVLSSTTSNSSSSKYTFIRKSNSLQTIASSDDDNMTSSLIMNNAAISKDYKPGNNLVDIIQAPDSVDNDNRSSNLYPGCVTTGEQGQDFSKIENQVSKQNQRYDDAFHEESSTYNEDSTMTNDDMRNHVVYGADASNAFAEAPPPKAPMYVYLDTQFREWWKARGYGDIHPSHKVMRVKKALQSHPESPRLWATLIDRIISDLGFLPCHHEPCLYVKSDTTGKDIYFLRQVDDFAVSAPTAQDAEGVISSIKSKISIQIKSLGVINCFNGVDVTQTQKYIKIYNKTYIRKIAKNKNWLEATIPKNDHIAYTPMHHDLAFNKNIESAELIPDKELPSVEKEMGFGYKQGIGKLIYAMVTCRPDISYPIIKLSQYSTKPARIHFEAVRAIYQYLKDTMEEGIHYWRTSPRTDCVHAPVPTTLTDYTNYIPHDSKTTLHLDRLAIQVDTSYTNDTAHRKSATGIVARLAGGAILYKTKFQDVVALSSTEAEFIAACDAGKNCLYIRSILEDMNIPQNEATIIYEDNQGAISMANAGRLTKRTKHIDTRNFAILSWVEQDLITLQRVPTNNNSSDALTKNIPRILFNRHIDYILGRTQPEYVVSSTSAQDTDAKPSKAISKGG